MHINDSTLARADVSFPNSHYEFLLSVDGQPLALCPTFPGPAFEYTRAVCHAGQNSYESAGWLKGAMATAALDIQKRLVDGGLIPVSTAAQMAAAVAARWLKTAWWSLAGPRSASTWLAAASTWVHQRHLWDSITRAKPPSTASSSTVPSSCGSTWT